MDMYMKKPSFLCDSDKSSAAASKISNKVLILIVLNLRVKPRDTLINNVDFIFGVSADGSAMLFERKTWS